MIIVEQRELNELKEGNWPESATIWRAEDAFERIQSTPAIVMTINEKDERFYALDSEDDFIYSGNI